jgi:hypothetical protein
MTVCPKPIRTGLIYTMGVPEEMAPQMGYDKYFSQNEWIVTRVLGPVETLCCYDTLQFDDYSKYEATRWDPEQKKARHRDVFPVDCQKAFEMGGRFAQS